MGAFTASVLSVVGTCGNLTTICALLQAISFDWYQLNVIHASPSKFKQKYGFTETRSRSLISIENYFQSRLRTHPTSFCLIALAASDLVFCVYNLPLTAYQVVAILKIIIMVKVVLRCWSHGAGRYLDVVDFASWCWLLHLAERKLGIWKIRLRMNSICRKITLFHGYFSISTVAVTILVLIGIFVCKFPI